MALSTFSPDSAPIPLSFVTLRTYYAISIVLLISRNTQTDEDSCKSSFIRKTLSLSAFTVDDILRRLSHAGITVGRRGAHGGYRLSTTIEQVTIFHITSALSISEQEALPENYTPPLEWATLSNFLFKHIHNLTLADLSSRAVTPRHL